MIELLASFPGLPKRPGNENIELPADNTHELPGWLDLMAEMWFDQDISEDSMTPRYFGDITLPLIIRGTSGRVGSLFLN